MIHEFAAEFSRLCISKQVAADQLMMSTYWENLKTLKFLPETLRFAQKRSFYRDFQHNITRMPDVSELIELNKEVVEIEYRKIPQLTEPKHIVDPTVAVRGFFVCDLVGHCGCDPDIVWDLLDSGQLQVAENYLSIRSECGIEFALQPYLDLINTIPKINGFIQNLFKVSSFSRLSPGIPVKVN